MAWQLTSPAVQAARQVWTGVRAADVTVGVFWARAVTAKAERAMMDFIFAGDGSWR